MPTDPLAPVTRGQPLAITAAAWNAAMAAARDGRQPGRPDAAGTGGSGGGYVEALALNDTGADLREFKPARVTAAGGFTVTDASGYDWNRRPVVTLDVPTAATEIVAVTLEAIPDGEYGRVAVAGWCLCDVDVSNSSHGYASPTTDTDALVSATTGSVRILATGTGTARRCVVYLGDQIAAGAGGATTNLLAFNTGTRVLTSTVNGTAATATIPVGATNALTWSSANYQHTSTVSGSAATANLVLTGVEGVQSGTSPTSISTGSGTWMGPTLGVSPGVGTFLCISTLRGRVHAASEARIESQRHVGAPGSEVLVTNSERLVVMSPAGEVQEATMTDVSIATFTSGQFLWYDFRRVSAGAFTTSQILFDGSGWVAHTFLRMA